jgi:inner membrane protein
MGVVRRRRHSADLRTDLARRVLHVAGNRRRADRPRRLHALDLPWQAELLLFAVLSAVAVYSGKRFYKGPGMEPADNPYLNRRQMGYVGRTFTLKEPIIDGRGRLTIEDTVWEIEGPDLSAGTRVKVTAVSGMSLIVEPL